MDLSRIAPLLDVARLQRSCVTLVGNGGGAGLGRSLVRCGLGRMKLVDFDTVEAVNVCRQEHMPDHIGRLKVAALAEELRRINPAVRVECYARDLRSFSDSEVDHYLGDTDLFVFAVDNHPANARGNEIALRLRRPAVWSGVYPGGRAGEVAFWHTGLRSCYRCLTQARYRAHERGEAGAAGESADVFAVQLIDSVTGMVALGLLTRGAGNVYGRLIERLGERNFLQLKVDPDYAWQGRDVFREQLRIPPDCDAYCSFVTVARRDPDAGEPPCPDCVRFLGRGPALPAPRAA